MSDAEPLPPEPSEPIEPAESAPPERVPFWGWNDVLVLIGLSLVCLVAAIAVVNGFFVLFHVSSTKEVFRALPMQFLWYTLLFLCAKMLFHQQYGRPFWRSLGWIDARLRPATLVSAGMLLAVAVVALSLLLKTPTDANSPINKLLADRTSLILVAVFGITVGPLCEELIFRGFLQPLFVRSFGVVPGVLLAAVPFGLLHLQQNGFYWQYGLLITMVGAALGWIRHRTGSTKASTIMHAAYNATFFLVALAAQRKNTAW
jgi:membrane protease YdiL (CAAX protease family)